MRRMFSENQIKAIVNDEVNPKLAEKQDALTPTSIEDGTITKVIGFDSDGGIVKGEAGGGGGTQLNELDCNYGSSYDDIITIVGIGDFFNFDEPNIDYFNTISTKVLKVIHNGKLVKSLSLDSSGGYIEVGSALTITYEDDTTATLIVSQIEYMGDGYIPL